jgi:DNA-directed RNA polymerase specialized sigma24 family protein
MMRVSRTEEFEVFVNEVEPGLRRALSGHLSADRVPDALSEAFTYAWQHWDRVQAMVNPSGYLFRVAQAREASRDVGAIGST